jgi:hypothetical protein
MPAKRTRKTKPPITSATPPFQNLVQDCQFTGVHFDAKSVEAIREIAVALGANAEALRVNAEGLLGLTEVFSTQNIHIDTLLKLVGPHEK